MNAASSGWVGANSKRLRNGADAAMRWVLDFCGFRQMYLPPLLLGGAFLIWSIARRKDRPLDMLGVTAGMVIESVAFALGLWAISHYLGPLLDGMSIQVHVADVAGAGPPDQAPALSSSLERVIGQVITYVGAGIYEEVLFRLLVFTGLDWVLCWVSLRPPWSTILAGAASSLLFSAAHHIGPNGDAFQGYEFLFRTLAGIYFVFLFRLRGFGIAAGAHACYDVLVGVPWA